VRSARVARLGGFEDWVVQDDPVWREAGLVIVQLHFLEWGERAG